MKTTLTTLRCYAKEDVAITPVGLTYDLWPDHDVSIWTLPNERVSIPIDFIESILPESSYGHLYSGAEYEREGDGSTTMAPPCIDLELVIDNGEDEYVFRRWARGGKIIHCRLVKDFDFGMLWCLYMARDNQYYFVRVPAVSGDVHKDLENV